MSNLNTLVYNTSSRLTYPLDISSSYALTASFALNGGGSGISLPYTTILTSSANWITASFLDVAEYVDLTISGTTYSFTSSNPPVVNQYSDLSLLINNTIIGATASLSFPSGWTNMNGGWPTSITASKNAWVFLRAYGSSQIFGTYLLQS